METVAFTTPPAAAAASAADPRRAAFEANKLRKRLCRQVGEAIADYSMIEDGDRVMVCVSGGKDSYGLLDILGMLKHRAPIRFEVIAVNLDQKQPGFPADVLPRYLPGARHATTTSCARTPTRSSRASSPSPAQRCSLCSRLRRGILYRVADELGATKIALGHHRDDIVDTFFLNMSRRALKAMPPKLICDDGKHVVIRPLAYVRERDIARYAEPASSR